MTYKTALEYHFTPDLMVFADYATGYKGLAYDLTSSLTTRTPLTSGPETGIPIADAIAAKQPIAPERSRDYELGFKGALDGSAEMNVWLHQQVMIKLAEGGGKVPDSLKHA